MAAFSDRPIVRLQHKLKSRLQQTAKKKQNQHWMRVGCRVANAIDTNAPRNRTNTTPNRALPCESRKERENTPTCNCERSRNRRQHRVVHLNRFSASASDEIRMDVQRAAWFFCVSSVFLLLKTQ